MTHTTTMGSMPKNLELARELIEHLIFEMAPLHSENKHIEQLLDAGDEYQFILLPGESLLAIVDNLKTAVKLASEPVTLPTTGRDREKNQHLATYRRKVIRLFAQVALALLDPDAAGDHHVDGTSDSLQRNEPLSTVSNHG